MKAMSWRRALIASLGLCGALALAGPAVAQEEGAGQDEGLATVLRGLEWRAGKSKVLDYFKKEKESAFQEAAGKVRDPIVKERMRREMAIAFEQIQKSDVSFTGQRSGYEVSIIAGEFRANNNESVLVVRDENAQRYFLFADGNLWKLVIAYNPEYIQGIGFDAFVEQVSRKYGEPEATAYNDDEVLTSASWKDDATELRIEDKSDFFNTFTMVFADRQTSERLSKFQTAFGGEQKKEAKVSQDILEIQKDSSFGNNEDVVDSIVGKVEVNLERGRPEDSRARRVGDDSIASADADLPGEEAKKRKKGDKGKGAKAKTDKGKGKGGDSLIIY